MTSWRIVTQEILEYGQEDRDGNGIEIVVDIQFVCPHLPTPEFLPQPEYGIARLDPTTEGIAVVGEPVVVTVQQESHEFENSGLFGTETIDGPLLARTHLVDALDFGNTGSRPIHECSRNRQISLVLDEVVSIAEHRPGETAFRKAVCQEFFPNRLVVELRDDALHKETKEKGE